MKVFVLTNADSLSAPAIKKLREDGSLAGVGVLQKHRKAFEPAIKSAGIDDKDIVSFNKSSWQEALKVELEQREVDVVFVMTFPWLIPSNLLEAIPFGFINFHFGLLPKYKGADPIFWQIKNREELGGISVHQMNEMIDEGPLIHVEKIGIIHGENYGLHCRRLGEVLPQILDLVIKQVESGEVLKNQPEPVEEAGFTKPPTTGELTIRWNEQSAEEIEWLVNASNPKYLGASATLAGTEMRILEVTPATLENDIDTFSGQIVHADVVYGLVVACKNNEFLRLTVVQTAEGFLSGIKLFNLGFQSGHRFT